MDCVRAKPDGLDNYSEPQPDLLLLKPAPDDYVSHARTDNPHSRLQMGSWTYVFDLLAAIRNRKR
jgi:hypothetical protein